MRFFKFLNPAVNTFSHIRQALQHCLIAKTQYREAKCFQFLLTYGIVRFRLFEIV